MDDETDKAAIEMEVSTGWLPGEQLVTAFINSQPFTFRALKSAEGYTVEHRGASYDIAVRSRRAAELAKLMPEKVAPDTSKLLLCPMPGLVVKVDVEVGQEVEEGQALCTIEAMKMENILRAEKKGVVAKINAGAGDSLAVDEIIMEFE